MEHAVHVDLKDLPPLPIRHLDERSTARSDAGVGETGVETAESFVDGVKRLLDLVGFGDVAVERHDAAAEGPQLFGGGVELVLLAA